MWRSARPAARQPGSEGSARILALASLACLVAACGATPRAEAAPGTLIVVVDASALRRGGAPPPGEHPGAVTPDATIAVKNAAGVEVAKLRTGERNEASVQLPPGDYLIVAPRGPLLPPQMLPATLVEGQATRIVVHLVNVAP